MKILIALVLLLLTGCAGQQLSPAECRTVGVDVPQGAKRTGTIIAEHQGTVSEVMKHCKSPFEPQYGCVLVVNESEYVVWYSSLQTLDHERCHALYEVWLHIRGVTWMLNIGHFKEEILTVALETIELYSPAAMELLLGTALQESKLRYLRQVGGGPALGLFQMEPATHDDIWENYLAYKPELARQIRILDHLTISTSLIGNLWYAAAMARVHYYRVPAPLPPAGDLVAQATYWKQYYNTPGGKGTTQEYVNNWKRYMT